MLRFIAVSKLIMSISFPAYLFLLLPMVFVAGPISAQAAQGRAYHALLIGASNYPNKTYANEAGNSKEEIISLNGPKNDVMSVYNMLRQLKSPPDKDGKTSPLFDPINIVIVADSLTEEFKKEAIKAGTRIDENPKYLNITNAFEELIARSTLTRDDFVYVHMSGHGVQAPALLDTREPDGMDEIFVPVDAGEWIPEKGIANTISDDQIADYIGRLKRKAFVWLVFDSCHSGDMVRGALDRAVTRRLDPRLFGVAFKTALKEARIEAQKKSPATRGGVGVIENPLADIAALGGPGARSGYVAFYAVQSNQLAIEKALPKADNKIMGLFTHSLIKAMNNRSSLSYDELAEALRAEYDRYGGQMRQPLIEGDTSQQVFFGGSLSDIWTASREGWRVTINAGELHNLSQGALVEIYPLGQAAHKGSLLGYGRVTGLNLTHASFQPIENKGKKAPEITKLPDQMSVKVLTQNASFELKIAVPPEKDYADLARRIERAQKSRRNRQLTGAPKALADKIHKAIVKGLEKSMQPKATDKKVHLKFVSPRDHADLYLRVREDRICMLGEFGDCTNKDSYGRQRSSASIALHKWDGSLADADRLALKFHSNFRKVEAAIKLKNLYKRWLAEGDKERLLSSRRLDLSMQILRYPHILQRSKQGEQHVCDQSFKAEDSNVETLRLSSKRVETVLHCDKLHIVSRNGGDRPIDLTFLYIDSEFGIGALPATGTIRLLAGNTSQNEEEQREDQIQFSTWCRKGWSPCPYFDRPWSTGIEHILAIAVERPTTGQHKPADFRWYAQSGIDHETKSMRGSRSVSPCAEQSGVAGELCHLLNGLSSGTRALLPNNPVAFDKVSMRMYRVNVQPPAPEQQLAGTQN